jgi:hypothetical protein
MKQQTAVEYLFEKLWEEPKDKLTWHTILEKAKEKEKEQHNETAEDWWHKAAAYIISISEPENQSFDKYYEERFNN